MPQSPSQLGILAQAAALRTACAYSDADLLQTVGETFFPAGKLTVGLDTSESGDHDSDSDGTSERVIVLLRDLAAVLKTVAKKNVDADLGRLISFLERKSTMPLRAIIEAMRASDNRSSYVAEHTKRLKESFGREGFEAALELALKDRRLKIDDFVVLSLSLNSKAHARESKKKIAERLLRLHRDLDTFRAKSVAMDGRSAA